MKGLPCARIRILTSSMVIYSTPLWSGWGSVGIILLKCSGCYSWGLPLSSWLSFALCYPGWLSRAVAGFWPFYWIEGYQFECCAPFPWRSELLGHGFTSNYFILRLLLFGEGGWFAPLEAFGGHLWHSPVNSRVQKPAARKQTHPT